MQLDDILRDRFEDQEQGGFFMTADDHEKLLVREKPAYDGAEPSGNSVTVLNLLRLYTLSGRVSYLERAKRCFGAFHTQLSETPGSMSEMLLALDWYLDSPREILLVYPEGKKADLAPFLQAMRDNFLPNAVVVTLQDGALTSEQEELIPWLQRNLLLKTL